MKSREKRIYLISGEARQSGVAVIELAFSLLFLLLLTVGITEIGRAFWYYSALQKGVRESARCLSLQPWETGANVSGCLALAVADANSAGINPALEASDLVVDMCDLGGGCRTSWGDASAPDFVSVTVADYQITWLWGFGGASGIEPGQQSGLRVVATMPYMY